MIKSKFVSFLLGIDSILLGILLSFFIIGYYPALMFIAGVTICFYSLKLPIPLGNIAKTLVCICFLILLVLILFAAF